MNKRDKNLYKRSIMRSITFGILFLVAVILSIVGLINNSMSAKQRYETLIAVDQSGGDVESALNDLRSYMYGHMNTKIGNDNGIRPPIQLQGTFTRLQQAEKARVDAANESLYATAQTYCEANQPSGFSGANRLQCIETYVDQNAQKTKRIDESFYRFDFVSPRWSADLAGFSLVMAAIFGAIFLIDLMLFIRVRRLVHMSR